MPQIDPDSLLAQIAQIDQRLDNIQRNNELAERELFVGRAEGDKRSLIVLGIAMRDELAEELRLRRNLAEAVLISLSK